MKTLKDFLNNKELNYKEYVDYLLMVFSELKTKNNQEILRTICKDIAGNNPEAKTATEVLIQNCSGILHELKMQKDSGYPNKKDEQIWNSLHYFQQYFKDWKKALLGSVDKEIPQLAKYSFNLPGEGLVDFQSFFNSDLFSEDTLQSYSGRKWPEPEKINATDDSFWNNTENPESNELFPYGSPNPKEIHQTTSGTCYMLASLRSLARSNPQMLKSLFRDVTDKTVTIRFYYGEKNKRTPVDITVDRTVIKGVDTECATWARLLEKAYAVYRTRKLNGDLGKIQMRNAYDFDAPSFFEALMPEAYRLEPTVNVVEAQPDFDTGKRKFIELLKSAQGPNTVMTLTKPRHVVELTSVTNTDNGVYVNYVDQFSGGEPQEMSISVDELFSPKSPFDTISVIQLNGNMPATHVSFYPQSCARTLQAPDLPLTEDDFVKDMKKWFVSEMTTRCIQNKKDANQIKPLSDFINDWRVKFFLINTFSTDISRRGLSYREFQDQINHPEDPNSIFKGFADVMATQLQSMLIDANKNELVSELNGLFGIKPAAPKQDLPKEQIRRNPPKVQANPTRPNDQPKQTATKAQPKQDLVKKLQATAPSIDNQIAQWNKFGEAHKEIQWNITNFVVANLKSVKGHISFINDGDISKLKSDVFIGQSLKDFVANAVVAKFLEYHDLPENASVKALAAGGDIRKLPALNDICTSLIDSPDQLTAFLTDPNQLFDQLLKDPDVTKCLENRFPNINLTGKAPKRINAEGDEIYYNELVRLNKALKKTDNSFSKDTDQYKYLHSYLEKATAELGKLKKENSSEFSAKLSEHMRKISDSCQYYKESHKNLKSLSSRQMQRIKVMNRLECLQFRRQEGVNNPTENVDYMLGDKITQAHMMQQIQGKNVEKYIHIFCDAKKMHKIIKNLAGIHPMQKVHGQQLSNDMKERLLKTPCTKLYANGVKLLNMSPEDYKDVKNNIEEFLNAEPQKPATQKQAVQQKAAPTQLRK